MRPKVVEWLVIVTVVYMQCVIANKLAAAGSALAERSAAALLARTLSSFARATRQKQESSTGEQRESFTARAHQLLDNIDPPPMTASSSNKQAIKVRIGNEYIPINVNLNGNSH